MTVAQCCGGVKSEQTVRRVTRAAPRIRTLRARINQQGSIMVPIIMTLMGGTTLLLVGQMWNFVDHRLTQWKGRIGS
jgi:hypothetical protein